MGSNSNVVGSIVLALTLGTGCLWSKGSGGPSTAGNASKVQIFNCTHVGDGIGVPSGHSYKIFASANGGTPSVVGEVNPQPGPWTSCHDAAHTAASITLDLSSPAGSWDVFTMRLGRGDEASCTSDAPSGAGVCPTGTQLFKTDVTAAVAVIDLTD